uniref:Uncharacterized protein n=1 Tax=Poecilia mexicana TaxID=48701 RepID=A0A3B3WYT9_9TELE
EVRFSLCSHRTTHLLVLLCPSGKITTTKNSPVTISNSIHTYITWFIKTHVSQDVNIFFGDVMLTYIHIRLLNIICMIYKE